MKLSKIGDKLLDNVELVIAFLLICAQIFVLYLVLSDCSCAC